MLLQIINHMFCVIIALVLGVRFYKKMDSFKSILFFQLLVWIMMYSLSHIVSNHQIANHIKENNQWVYNVSTFIEISFLSTAGFYYFNQPLQKKLIVFAYLLFLTISLIIALVYGVMKFNIYSYIPGSLIITLIYSFILYDCFSTEKESKLRDSNIWICLGILLYFAVNLPYFSMFNYLNTNHPALSALLFHLITQVLSNVRYLLLAVGFWLLGYNSLIKTKPTL